MGKKEDGEENHHHHQHRRDNHRHQQQQQQGDPPLMALNHVSRLCRDVKKSVEFYTKVLGMVETERPQALDFEGAWLFNYGIGIHLVQAKDEARLPDIHQNLDPMDNHISFQCQDMEEMEKRLKQYNVKYMKRTMEDEDQNGTKIDQLFFDDPDGFMIEICNCENVKLVPSDASLATAIKLPTDRHNPPLDTQNGTTNHSEPQNN
ncbi:glyoxylase I 4 [Mercurialis annua]|uniref:glyoxylase I 4 n=1 Tax=Mercurialis annua TaxID=3986 RepID=UPI00215EA655|nr:glyoxylase I 4 [Mercurialis annua]